MKPLLAITIMLLGAGCPAAEQRTAEGSKLTRFNAVSGSTISLKGESSIHEWKARGTLIGGFFQVESGFPDLTRPATKSAMLQARAEVFIPVRNLKAVGESWEPYNEQRTVAIHRMLRADEHPKIYFRLSRLEPRASPSVKEFSAFAAVGDLAIAGVTNRVSLSIRAARLKNGTIQLSGKTTIKQSDFRIIPKSTAFRCFAADPDPVEIAFDWILKETGSK